MNFQKSYEFQILLTLKSRIAGFDFDKLELRYLDLLREEVNYRINKFIEEEKQHANDVDL